MIIYWVALLITCLLTFFLFYWKKNANSKVEITHLKVFLAFSPLFLVALLRWNVGVDVVYGTGYYYKAYEAIKASGSNIFNYEPGFYLLMRLCSSLGFNLYMFYCLITILFFFLFTKFIANNSKNIVIASILFVLSDLYLFTFSTLRQSLGIAFALYPMSLVLKKKYFYKNWKWWVSSIVAYSMHGTILYLFIIVILSRIKIKRSFLILLTAIFCITSPLLSSAIGTLVSHMPYFNKYFGSNMYINSFAITYFAIALIMLIISLLNYKNLINSDENNYTLINICAFTTILMANSKMLIMPYRIFPLFVPIYILVASNILATIKRKTYKQLFTSLYLILPFLMLFINQYYISIENNYFEYKSIFDYSNQVWSK